MQVATSSRPERNRTQKKSSKHREGREGRDGKDKESNGKLSTRKSKKTSTSNSQYRNQSLDDQVDLDASFEPVDFSKLELSTLKKYKRYYKLRTRSSSNKAELVAAIAKHFQTMQISESQILETFVYLIKRKERKNKA
eukprot:TRINITY_DN6897_c0_g1_i2.p1 TRINITY_DN6897_c0_g1~~TRINITY_DN6897_c0_g1_i2.p1  ORF type:complete len:138 (+),score=31.67 TRINITY_DN6897_c0_g1_i2:55-468(+)